MSSSWMLSALLAALTIYCTLALDEDFAFDVSDDLEVEFPPDTPKKVWGMTDITATVGRVFHLAIPKDSFGDAVKNYEAKTDQDQPLPSWLLFDKTGGVFWGVPLEEDIGILHISVKAVRQSNSVTDEFTLIVSEDNSAPDGIDKCPSTEDSTVLTLIIDKDIKAIKPKQRVIAINNIAKFFAMPYNAFTLKPQTQPDDITDSSVVLAGPGNLKTRTSKLTSLVQVAVGCEGRLWLNAAPIVHQLKQQARDGTITEVLRLPLVGWRVKTETRPLIRAKRQEDTYVGSGDYEEYYEYDDYDDPDKDPDEPILSSPSTPTPNTVGTTHTVVHSNTYSPYPTTAAVSETHPHRHHHGEIRPVDETEPSIQVERGPDLPTTFTEPTFAPKTEESEETPQYISPQQTTILHTPAETTTTTTTAMTTQTVPVTEASERKSEIVTPISGLYKPSETLDSDDEYDDEYDDGDDEESITEIPFTRNDLSVTNNAADPNAVLPEIISDTETTVVDVVTTRAKTEPFEFITETVPIIKTTIEDLPPTTTTTTTEETAPPVTTTTTSTTTTTTTPEPPTTTTASTTTEKLTTVEESTTTKHTTLRHTILSTTTQKATTPQVTESIVYEVKNFAPTIQIRLNRIAVTAGKNFSQVVPEDMFTDMEDGNNLKLEFLDKDGNPIKKNLWCQFNPRTREIYGLPLEEDVSRWEFILKATDKEGASVSERVEIIVQQHKYWRVVNHEFSLFARVEKKQDFVYPVDWALHILRGIGNVFQTSNTSKITVRRVNYATDPIIFTWTNDTLATNYCPKSDIDLLFSMLTANDEGDPSIALNRSLAPELRAKKVTQHRTGVCEEIEVPQPPPPPPDVPVTPPSHLSPILPPSHLAPVLPPSNLAPILRNAVDHVNATVGELLVYRVPDDTFYDPEDVDPRNLKVQLYTVDRQPISSDHWLQFDSKNKEFYGIPTSRDARRAEYQLVCEDSGGLTASDTLVVEIHPAPKVSYNVEFNMTVETDYDAFVISSAMKRKFVENLKKLFGDDNTNHIHLSAMTKGNKDSTIVTWYNKSLTRDECPWEDIKDLKQILVNHERTISSRVHKAMGDEFPVTSFSLQDLGVCKTTTPATTRAQDSIVPVEEGTSSEEHDEYFITFIIPAVIIAAMLILAGIAACVLYRRRRSGKMNIEEDGRQSYGNKGIPVIFQEELDEKPEPGTKTPVILKDEKPPLAPPEYSKSGSLKLAADDSEPYQPPPPFTRTQDNGRQPRPKPTPTYRKPPPYVPP